MTNYRVKWEIDIDADSPEEAARRALSIQRNNDPANAATVFDVSWVVTGFATNEGHAKQIDLGEQEMPSYKEAQR